MPRQRDVLPPELVELAAVADRAEAISKAHPLDAPVDPVLARYRAALKALVDDREAILAAMFAEGRPALFTLGERPLQLSAEHIAASRALVASRDA